MALHRYPWKYQSVGSYVSNDRIIASKDSSRWLFKYKSAFSLGALGIRGASTQTARIYLSFELNDLSLESNNSPKGRSRERPAIFSVDCFPLK
jgi:hypothetical protein